MHSHPILFDVSNNSQVRSSPKRRSISHAPHRGAPNQGRPARPEAALNFCRTGLKGVAASTEKLASQQVSDLSLPGESDLGLATLVRWSNAELSRDRRRSRRYRR